VSTDPAKPRRKSASGPSVPHAQRKGVRLDVYVPDDLAGRLDDRCIDMGMSRTEAVRVALEAWLQGSDDGPEAPEPPRAPKRPVRAVKPK